jgi:hypothetical protein
LTPTTAAFEGGVGAGVDTAAVVALGAGVAAWAWDASGFLSPPQAKAPHATRVVSRVNRIADVLRDVCERWLVNAFTI